MKMEATPKVTTIIKIGAVKETKTVRKIDKTKSCFFETMKNFTRLIKKTDRGQRKSEMKEKSPLPLKTQRILRYYE